MLLNISVAQKNIMLTKKQFSLTRSSPNNSMTFGPFPSTDRCQIPSYPSRLSTRGVIIDALTKPRSK